MTGAVVAPQAPTPVGSTTVGAAACASPRREAGSAAAQMIRSWTRQTTPAVKVCAPCPCPRPCPCLCSLSLSSLVIFNTPEKSAMQIRVEREAPSFQASDAGWTESPGDKRQTQIHKCWVFSVLSCLNVEEGWTGMFRCCGSGLTSLCLL